MPLEDMDDDLVMVSRRDSFASMTSSPTNKMKGHWTWLLVVVGACCFGLVLFGRQDFKFVSTAQDVSVKKSTLLNDKSHDSNVLAAVDETCTLQCSTNTSDSFRSLLRHAQEAHANTIVSLKVKYGEYFDKLFYKDGVSIGKSSFASPSGDDTSQKRFRQRLMKKLLTTQVQSQESIQQACHCNDSKRSSRRRRKLPQSELLNKFVWVTGGHSAAAGHGNFIHEAYTAVLEDTVKPVFASVGLGFEGRNHAMGGMNSAPELALCNEAIYGLDADVISWDFGMTDGRTWWRKYMYGTRIGVHRNRPAIVEFGFGGRVVVKRPRVEQLLKLQNMGLTCLYLQDDLWDVPAFKTALPDMQTVENHDDIPEFVRHFKCGNEIEGGDPTCGQFKFTPTKCRLEGRARWHPGWKTHALTGNIIAMFLMDALLEAVQTLVDTFEADDALTPQALLEQLQKKEDEDYELFFKSELPKVDFIAPEVLEEIPNASSIFYRNAALCHTAILPSQSRYLGIVSNTTQQEEPFQPAADNRQPYETANEWRLVMDGKEHDRNKDCPTIERIDYKDWFFVKTQDGPISLTLPNQAEREAYVQGKELQGMIALCFVMCPWGKCEKGTISMEEINNGNATFTVNDQPVKELKSINPCALFKGEDGYKFRPSADGSFKITAQIHSPDSLIKISSVIVF